MDWRVQVRPRVLVERDFVGEEPVLRNREPLTDLHGLEGGKHRDLRRKRVREVVDRAKPIGQPDRLRLREQRFRCECRDRSTDCGEKSAP
jgi:hypothetical protein